MKFIPAKCPVCNGELQIPNDREFVKCMYCSCDIKVREVLNVKYDLDIPNLLKLGDNYIEAGNYEKAIGVFEKILEFDAENYRAWLGLGHSYKKSKYFKKALEFVPEEEKDKLKLEIIRNYCSLSIGIELLDELLEKNENSWNLWLIKGVSYGKFLESTPCSNEEIMQLINNILTSYSNALKFASTEEVDEVKKRISKRLWYNLDDIFPHNGKIFDYISINLDEDIFRWILQIVEWANSLDPNFIKWEKAKIDMCEEVLIYGSLLKKNGIHFNFDKNFYKNKLKEYKNNKESK